MTDKPDLRVLATFEHYAHHMLPIVDELRGRGLVVDVYSTQAGSWWGEYVHPSWIEFWAPTPWLVAASVDASKLAGQQLIYLEHGAGQTYPGDTNGVDNAGYSDGPINDAIAFLCPNLFVMARRLKRYPDVPAFLVGVPKMDHFYGSTGFHDGVERNVIALAFHWNGGTCEETQTAFEHYRPRLRHLNLALRRRGLVLVGHGHPRIAKRLRYHYERAGIDWWDHDDVLMRASLLVVDNSSIGYEFASLDRPTVWLNAPQYRRHVHHGLRFWEFVPGRQVDGPDELEEAIVESRFDRRGDDWADRRRAITDLVYPARDGNASWRAATAIEKVLH